jgi:hypothetical protein
MGVQRNDRVPWLHAEPPMALDLEQIVGLFVIMLIAIALDKA